MRGISVELAEVAALIRHADVGQRDAHQPWREEHHLETVVLQGWRWAEIMERVEVGWRWGGSGTAWDGVVEEEGSEERDTRREEKEEEVRWGRRWGVSDRKSGENKEREGEHNSHW